MVVPEFEYKAVQLQFSNDRINVFTLQMTTSQQMKLLGEVVSATKVTRPQTYNNHFWRFQHGSQ